MSQHGPIMSVRRTLIATIPVWAQPIVLALLLALVAWPIVAMTWGVGYRDQHLNTPVPESGLVQWTAAAGGVFLSALVAGSIGGLVVRRNAIAGAMFTFVLALTVAIPAAALLPVFLGQQNVCDVANIGSPCDPITATAHVIIDDLQSLPLLFLFAPLVEPVAVLTLALGVGAWTTCLQDGADEAVRPPNSTRR
jgi:hypothetical protein